MSAIAKPMAGYQAVHPSRDTSITFGRFRKRYSRTKTDETIRCRVVVDLVVTKGAVLHLFMASRSMLFVRRLITRTIRNTTPGRRLRMITVTQPTLSGMLTG